VDDTNIRDHIEQLVAEEHRLLGSGDRHKLTPEDRDRLDTVEVQLDQYWDLLRQRRARRDANQDPEASHLRDARIVEKYEQ
jgi:hypothetical protein